MSIGPRDPQVCDVLIEAGWVVPVVPRGVVLADHAVAVRDGAVIGIHPIAEARELYLPAEHVKRPDAALIPGLINGHTHNPMTLMRGVADDLPLMTWLNDHIWPIEGRIIGTDMVADGVTLAIAEMLRGGTTTCNENYFFPDVQAQVYKRHGFRAVVGLPVIDFPTAWAKDDDEYFDKARQVHDQWLGDPLIGTAFAPHAPYTVKDSSFERMAMLAEQLDIPVHCHVHETQGEVDDAMSATRLRPLARLDRLGVVSERLIAVHMTAVDDADIALCADKGVSVVHCPESNLKLASGFCPVARLQEAGINIAIGTDGAASNNDLDMFGEMRTAALLAKAVAGDATALQAGDALYAATMGGALAMGLAERVGSIECGKRADLVCVDLGALETQPIYHVLSQLVYSTGRQHVTDVWIDGVAKLRSRVLVDMDLDAIVANARSWGARISNA